MTNTAAPAIVVGLGERRKPIGKVLEAYTLIDDPNWNRDDVDWVEHTLHVYHTFHDAVEDYDKRFKEFETELMKLCGCKSGEEITPLNGDYETYTRLWSSLRHLTDIAEGMAAYEALHFRTKFNDTAPGKG